MTLRPACVLLLALLPLAMPACAAAPRPSNGPLIAPADAQKLGYVTRWSTDLALPRDCEMGEIAVLDDILVTTEHPTNLVTAVALRDGSLLWRHVVGEPSVHLFKPTRIGDRLLINSEHKVYLLSVRDGRLLALSDLETPVNNGPAMSGSVAIFGGDNGLIFAHDVNTGYSSWRVQLPASIIARPVVQAGSVFTADSHGNYVAYTVRGELLWQGRAHARISAEPVLTPNGVFVASEDQCLYALNRANGKDRWIYRATAPLQRSPVILSGSVYLPLPTGGLVSIDPLNGSELWKTGEKAQPVVLQDQRLLLATARSLIIADNQSGKTLTQVPVGVLRRILPGPENCLLLIDPNGKILRLDPK